jgi:hypothetical protein
LLRDIHLHYFQNLINLEHLDFHFYSKIQGDGLKYLKHLPKLRSFYLYNCNSIDSQFRDDNLVHFKDMNNLEELNLLGCHITDKGLEHLKSLFNLRYLNIGGCRQISDKGLESFKELN